MKTYQDLFAERSAHMLHKIYLGTELENLSPMRVKALTNLAKQDLLEEWAARNDPLVRCLIEGSEAVWDTNQNGRRIRVQITVMKDGDDS